MREPPRLAADLISAALRSQYGIAVDNLAFLPLGNDSASSVYRVHAADGTVYFLKARAQAGFSALSLAIPRYLCDQGIRHVMAPIPTMAQALWTDVDGFALSLYPLIEGQTGADAGLSAQHWREFGHLMASIHSIQLPPALKGLVPYEPYIPSRRSVIDDLRAAVVRPTPDDAIAGEFASFWHAHAGVIDTVVGRADALANQLRQASRPLVLCHADMHLWNLLVDQDKDWWLVDWDETVLAPKERDLMFVVGGIGGYVPDTDSFMQGYGETTIDPIALAYYRYAWAVQDMAAYGEQVFFQPGLGDVTRRDALRGFMSQFKPGGIVELALATSIADG